MKYFFSLLLMAGAGYFMSCSKSETEASKQAVSPINITGEWKWAASLEGWGAIVKPAADSVVKLSLRSDSSYQVTLNDEVKYSGYFSSFTIPSQDSLRVLQFDNHFSVHLLRLNNNESLIYLKGDSCRLYDYQISDGASHLFIKAR